MSGRQAIAAEAFRAVLGHLPTGVTVITANADGVRVGLACNSVTSVSLDPPLISFCAGRTSKTWPEIRRAARFCVNILADHHERAGRDFSRYGVDRFAGLSWHERHGGPGIDDAVAWIDCDLNAQHDAGDHVIVVGEVIALEARSDASPLIFYRGTYGSFAAAASQSGTP